MGRCKIKLTSFPLYKRYMKDVERYIEEKGEIVRYVSPINSFGKGKIDDYLINKWCPCPEYLYRALYEEGFSKLSVRDLHMIESYFYGNSDYAQSYRSLVSSLSYEIYDTVYLVDVKKQILKVAVDSLVFDIDLEGCDCASSLERLENVEIMRGKYARTSIYIILRCLGKFDILSMDIETKKSLQFKQLKIREVKVEDEAEMRLFKRKVLLT